MATVADPELFAEMLKKAIGIYESKRHRMAEARTPHFQKSVGYPILWQVLDDVLSLYILEGKIDEKDRGNWHFQLRREVDIDQRCKAAAEKIRNGPDQKTFDFT